MRLDARDQGSFAGKRQSTPFEIGNGYSMIGRALLRGTLATFLTVLVSMDCGIAQAAPSSDQPFIHVFECNAQPEYAPAAFFSPALYPAGPGPFLDVDADGPLYALLAPEPIGAALSISYANATTRVMKSVDFGFVSGGSIIAHVRDVGRFSPHAAIKHDFEIDAGVFKLRAALAQCIPLHITYADGSTWTNPDLSH